MLIDGIPARRGKKGDVKTAEMPGIPNPGNTRK